MNHRSWLLHVTLALVCSATAWAMDLMPYAGPQAPLAKDDTEKRHALWRSLLVDAYLKHGDHDPKFDADMKLVLEASAADLVGKQAPADELFPIAERLAGPGGSTDPMADFAWFVFARHRGGQTVLMACNNAMAAYQAEVRDHQDKPRYAFAAYACLMNFCLTTHDVAQHPDQLASATQVGDQLRGLLIMAINAHEYDPAPTSLIRTVDQISVQNTDMAEAFITDLGAALEESKTEPWLKHTVLASLGIKAAWAWRGRGWASTVTEQGWAGFKRHLEATEKHLTEAYRLNPNHPAIGKMGITLAGAGFETIPMEEWFRRSIAACFDDPDAFSTYRQFRTPRWGGTYDDLLSLACDAVATKRFDTDVPWQIITTITYLVGDAKSMQLEAKLQPALAQPAVRKALAACFAGYAARYPKQAAGYRCWEVGYLWHSGDKAGARTLLLTIDREQWSSTAASEMDVDFEKILFETEPAEAVSF